MTIKFSFESNSASFSPVNDLNSNGFLDNLEYCSKFTKKFLEKYTFTISNHARDLI
jgi:hypothetical protein